MHVILHVIQICCSTQSTRKRSETFLSGWKPPTRAPASQLRGLLKWTRVDCMHSAPPPYIASTSTIHFSVSCIGTAVTGGSVLVLDIILDLATAVDLARARSTSSYTVYIVRADLHAASHDPLPLSQQPAHSRGEGPARGHWHG